MAQHVNALFEAMCLQDFKVIEEQHIIEVSSQDSLSDAVQIIATHNILSAPVKGTGVPSEETWVKKYDNILSLRDILVGILDNVSSAADMAAFRRMEVQFFMDNREKPTSRLSPFVPITTQASFLDALWFLSTSDEPKGTPLPRMMMVPTPRSEARGYNEVKIVSQATAAQIIVDLYESKLHYLSLNVLANRTISQAGLGVHKPVVTGDMAQNTLRQAFQTLVDSQINAVPLVDSQGNYVSTLSVSDVVSLMQDEEASETLKQPVEKFIQRLRRNRHGSRLALLICRGSDTIIDVMSQILAHKMHRAWLTDESDSHKVVGVVSLCDLLGAFVDPPELKLVKSPIPMQVPTVEELPSSPKSE